MFNMSTITLDDGNSENNPVVGHSNSSPVSMVSTLSRKVGSLCEQ